MLYTEPQWLFFPFPNNSVYQEQFLFCKAVSLFLYVQLCSANQPVCWSPTLTSHRPLSRLLFCTFIFISSLYFNWLLVLCVPIHYHVRPSAYCRVLYYSLDDKSMFILQGGVISAGTFTWNVNLLAPFLFNSYILTYKCIIINGKGMPIMALNSRLKKDLILDWI